MCTNWQQPRFKKFVIDYFVNPFLHEIFFSWGYNSPPMKIHFGVTEPNSVLRCQGKLKALPDKGICISLKPILVQHHQNKYQFYISKDFKGSQVGINRISSGFQGT